MKTQFKILLTFILLGCFAFMSGLLKSDKQIVSAKVSMNILCEECIKDLKQNLYEGKNFAFYAKTKDWVKSISKTSSNNLITYKIDVKNPLFKNKNNFYFDENFEIFFMPSSYQLPMLSIDDLSISEDTISQAIAIRNEISELKSLNYSNLSGWEIETSNAIAYIGKADLNQRIRKYKKIIVNLDEKNTKLPILDLRYQQGYVLIK